MKHTEEIAERLAYFGGKLTTVPDPIFVGENLKEMLETDKRAEKGAIELYKGIINIVNNENDSTTAQLFRQILSDEEDHLDVFSGLLEDI